MIAEVETVSYRQPQRQIPTQTFCLSVGAILGELEKYTYPELQRRFTWPKTWKQALIESILEGISIPPVLFHKKFQPNGSTVYEVVDGQQRLKTLMSFLRGEFPTFTIAEARRGDAGGEIPIEPGKYFYELTTISQNMIKDFELTIQCVEGLNKHQMGVYYRRCNNNELKLTMAEKLISYDSRCLEYARILSKHPFWVEIYTGDTIKCQDIQGSIYPLILEMNCDHEYVSLNSAKMNEYAFGSHDKDCSPAICEKIKERLDSIFHLFTGETVRFPVNIIPLYQTVLNIERAGYHPFDFDRGCLKSWLAYLLKYNLNVGYGDAFRKLVNINRQREFWERHGHVLEELYKSHPKPQLSLLRA